MIVQENAKQKLQAEDALKLVKDADHLYATKGRKLNHIDLSSGNATNDEILALMLGPTGNLRAPVVRSGKTIIVGYDEETYQKVLQSE